MNEIRYRLVKYKDELGINYGIVIGDVIIDCLGSVVEDYYDLEILEFMIACNRYSDIGIEIIPLLFVAWKKYKDSNLIIYDKDSN
ncbi:hypothetical protein [Dysgonomonas sp. ZJ709]|uniref:hypothetical protein n=1 Tax=Dysgonomonas sp. ZJ709 TaxID=2709797 RepID=UPI0013EC20BF|nr:hypothetical protein [Dysgonomonas sp. ZJ709]